MCLNKPDYNLSLHDGVPKLLSGATFAQTKQLLQIPGLLEISSPTVQDVPMEREDVPLWPDEASRQKIATRCWKVTRNVTNPRAKARHSHRIEVAAARSAVTNFARNVQQSIAIFVPSTVRMRLRKKKWMHFSCPKKKKKTLLEMMFLWRIMVLTRWTKSLT